MDKGSDQNQNDKPETSQPSQTGENVVFDKDKTPPPPAAAEIPEEYLTDEDLYPTAPEGGSNIADLAKKKKPLIAFGLGGLILFVIILIGIGRFLGAAPARQEKVTLTYWGVWEPAAVMDEVIRDYQRQNPYVEIEYTLMDAKDSYRERLLERTRKGTGPDIFRYHNTWPAMIKEILAPAPQTVFTPTEFQETFYPVAARDLILNNQIIGVPMWIDGLTLIYNDKILKAAGVGSPPDDWEALLEVADKITVRDEQGNLVTAGVALGAAENISHFSDIVAMMFLQNGVDIKNLKNDFNARTVMDTYTGFVLSGNNYWADHFDNSINAFANEQVGMILAPTWQIEVIKRMNPDIDLKTASVPQIRGADRSNIANYWADGVSRASKQQEEAWKFLKYLSQKDTQTKIFELEIKNGRLFGSPYARKDMAELLLQDPNLGPIVRDAPILSSLPIVSLTYDNGLNDRLVGYMKDSINSMLLSNSVAKSIEVMDDGFSQVFQEYGY